VVSWGCLLGSIRVPTPSLMMCHTNSASIFGRVWVYWEDRVLLLVARGPPRGDFFIIDRRGSTVREGGSGSSISE
jgi:hypothetical protein